MDSYNVRAKVTRVTSFNTFETNIGKVHLAEVESLNLDQAILEGARHRLMRMIADEVVELTVLKKTGELHLAYVMGRKAGLMGSVNADMVLWLSEFERRKIC